MDLETGGQEFCDSLCKSADVIIARTDAMVHQTQTDLPSFPQPSNTCDVIIDKTEAMAHQTILPSSFSQSLNACDVKPSLHHSVQVVPILNYETGIHFFVSN